MNYSDLPVFAPVQPVGKCGVCNRALFPHSTPSICGFKQECPMHGEEWMRYQRNRQMQNTWINVASTPEEAA